MTNGNNAYSGIGVRGWLGILLILVAGIGGVYSVVVPGMVRARESLSEIQVPGTAEVRLDRAGGYVLFHEYPRTSDSLDLLKPEGIETLEVSLQGLETGAPVPLQAAATPQRYAIQRMVGEALYTFDVEQPGTYLLTAQYPAGHEGDSGVFKVKREYPRHLAATMGKGALILLGTAGILSAFIYRVSRHAGLRHRGDVEFNL